MPAPFSSTPSLNDYLLECHLGILVNHCGWGEIRTHGPLAKATVFKTVPLDHSGTHPCIKILSYFAHIFNLEYTEYMKLLGIDYGSKRVGIAYSDEGEQFAMPLITLDNSKNLIQDIIDISIKNGIQEIVLGESKDYKGEANKILQKSLEFKEELEKKGFTVYLEPEFMTSANAERFQGKTDMIDASAAALILQSFLDKRRARG